MPYYKRLTALFMLAAALSSTLAIFIEFSMANFIPEPIPPGIRINSDGSIEGTDRIRREGDVYTFKGDILGSLVVLRDNIVIDGAGFTLKGEGHGTGIFLQERNGVTIKNLKVHNFECGIKFTWLVYGPPSSRRSNKVVGCIIANNTCGILLSDFSSGSMILDNVFEDNIYGVRVYAFQAVFRNNRFWNNTYAVSESVYVTSDIDASNMVNGKPIYYWVGLRDRTVPRDAGWVVLKNCSGITVQGLSIEHNDVGILLCYTNDSRIIGNIVKDNSQGIMLWASSNNLISENLIMHNHEVGLRLDGDSRNNIIAHNKITANIGDGIYFEAAAGNTVTENHISWNEGNGIFIRNIQDSKVIGNNISFNKNCGVGFGFGPNGTIKMNYISKNMKGVWISNGFNNTVTLNSLVENMGWAIELEGSQKNNRIHHNNFINNCPWERRQAHVAPIWVYPGEPEPPRLVGGAANFWDDGREGNYWSDYNGTDADGNGIGDTPYIINENNRDHYPLMKPLNIHAVDASPPSIIILSPKNRTYEAAEVPLIFILDEPAVWIRYSLDGKANVTIKGNITLTNLSVGSHSLRVYAMDAYGNVGASESIYFTIKASPLNSRQNEAALEGWIPVALSVTALASAVLLAIFFKIRIAKKPAIDAKKGQG